MSEYLVKAQAGQQTVVVARVVATAHTLAALADFMAVVVVAGELAEAGLEAREQMVQSELFGVRVDPTPQRTQVMYEYFRFSRR